MHPRLRGNNLVTRYVLTEVYHLIPNKSAYMDDETWVKVMKLVAPGIIKMKVSYMLLVFSLFYSTYI